MNTSTAIAGAAALAAGLILRAAPAPVPLAGAGFEKIVLNDAFYCEGINVGDFNRDGHPDIVAGPFCYEGPDFKKRHVIWKQDALPPEGGASESAATFVYDFNGDGWPDILVLGRAEPPANAKPNSWEKVVMQQAYWFANPGAKEETWQRYFVFPRVMGESPIFGDLDGDGSPELMALWESQWGLLKPRRNRPADPWEFTPISRVGDWRVYYHGMGMGDIDGDGRPDLVLNEGIFFQPAQRGGSWREQLLKFSPGRGGAQILVFDVNGDGRNDVVSALDGHGWGLSWFEQKQDAAGAISFAEHRIMGDRSEEAKFGLAFSQVHALEAADLDGDGLTDFVTGKRWWAHGPTHDLEPDGTPVLYWFQLVRDKDGARFVPHLIDDKTGVGAQIILQDVNGDGAPDVLVASKKGAFLFINHLRDKR
jgi:hypothetical protein